MEIVEFLLFLVKPIYVVVQLCMWVYSMAQGSKLPEVIEFVDDPNLQKASDFGHDDFWIPLRPDDLRNITE